MSSSSHHCDFCDLLVTNSIYISFLQQGPTVLTMLPCLAEIRYAVFLRSSMRRVQKAKAFAIRVLSDCSSSKSANKL